MTTTTLAAEDLEQRDALVGRLLATATGAMELLHVYLGHRLGLYQALADKGALSARELAAAAGINSRYAREWLEEQAVAGILTVEPGSEGAGERRYVLPPGHVEPLTDADSVNFVAPLAPGVVAMAAVIPEVLDAFRTGGGVPYESYGSDMRNSIAMLNRPGFLTHLGSKWFTAIPDVDKRLRAQPPARVADVGCGTGWSSIAIAKAYPLVTVDGFDLDSASIEEARRNAGSAGVADRVNFEIRDAADPAAARSYDLVTAFETIHDMSNPVGALRAMRGLLKEGGVALVVDERVAEEFTAPGDDLERFMYGWSALHCLPVGMVDPDSAGTGTVMRPAILRDYAQRAGFFDAQVLDVEADFWRFYRLV